MASLSTYTKPIYTQLLCALAILCVLPVPIAEAQPTAPLNNVFRRILDSDDEEPPLISRGDLCLIAPATAGVGTPAIWHEQPVMVFQPGSIEKLALRNEATNVVFWEYYPSSTTHHVVYDGEPLQSEVIYRLDVYLDAEADRPTTFPDFRLLPEFSRQHISEALAMNATPKDTDLSAAHWTAIQRADYFVEQGMRLDAIQALFNVDVPSAELATLQQQLIESICKN
ncbi:hypothetical protein IQ260_14835 [Leptolyngbya cf. ectocarpi LEGE 11479]|uniref:DUF928 domain-containing protein n=1 Tax=Leptolyngbya cf. ectocarpi LEGE 11479 TaxID=1828722 RepID=A0A929F9K8_LEPEC|nr:hypothetical protein [Leptolyngbya ectocarpi]MBE9067927.1 hypothetical protein [Leptolyngbya cf. ectocarpi LEGE 11479]